MEPKSSTEPGQWSAMFRLKCGNINQPFVQIILFLGIFALLQTLYGLTNGTWFERLVIDNITVKTAAFLINEMTPSLNVLAINTHLSAVGGGINVANGCNGLEVMFILVAAMLIAPLNCRAKLWGLLLGIPYIFILNQARLIALFYTFRTNKLLFSSLHGTVAPILLIALTIMFFSYWLSRHQIVKSQNNHNDIAQ